MPFPLNQVLLLLLLYSVHAKLVFLITLLCLLIYFAEKEANGSADYGHSQPQMGAVYGANQHTNSVVEPTRNYYQVFIYYFYFFILEFNKIN